MPIEPVADETSRPPELGSQPLRNTYAVMRHGQSHPNVAGLIICRPEDGIDRANGLTELGRRQARESAAAWAAAGNRAPVIVSSDFSRALQTAEELRSVTGSGPVRIDVRLRERDFGDHHGGPVSGYDEVWTADAAGDTAPGVEPVAAVLARTIELIRELDTEYANQQIVLVSHGDTAQITVAGFAGLNPTDHRSLPGLGNAEIRILNHPRATPG